MLSDEQTGIGRARRQAAREASRAATRWAGNGRYEQIWVGSQGERECRWRADAQDERGAEVDVRRRTLAL
jgi:hypothetical protein